MHYATRKSPPRWGAGGLLMRLDMTRYDEMVPLVGIELTTYRLQGGCSTN
jgi:hypothetical protein